MTVIPHCGGMMEFMAVIFSGLHLTHQVVFRDRQHDIALNVRFCAVYTNSSSIHERPEFDFDLWRLAGGLRNRFLGAARVVANEFGSAVHNHLRRVRSFDPESRRILFLAFCIRMRRETVAPSLMVPVVHMESQRDDLRAVHG